MKRGESMRKKQRVLQMVMALALVLGLMGLWKTNASAAGNVAVNENNFPDEIFRAFVSTELDENHDNTLTEAEILAVKTISVSGREIESLKGIEFFTALEELYCSANQLISLNLTKNTELRSLSCDNNAIVGLDLSKNTKLERVYCNGNGMHSINLSAVQNLQMLYCYGNQFEVINLKDCPKLVDFYQNGTMDASNWQCNVYDGTDGRLAIDKGQKLEAVNIVQINATNFPSQILRDEVANYDKDGDGWLGDYEITKIKTLKFRNVSIPSFKGLEYLTDLQTIDLYEISDVQEIDLSKNNKLVTICVYGFKGTTPLIKWGSFPKVTDISALGHCTLDVDSLDFSNTNLRYANINVDLEELDFSDCPYMTGCHIYSENLKKISFKNDSALEYVRISGTKVQELDVSGLEKLRALECDHNNLKKLSVSDCPKLEVLLAYGNPDLNEVDLSGAPILQKFMTNPRSFDVYSDGSWAVGEKIRFEIRMQAEQERLSFDGHTKVTKLLPINEAFPDEVLRDYVVNHYDVDHDGYLDSYEIFAATDMNLSGSAFSSAQGIQCLLGLKNLTISNTNIEDIEVGSLSKLENLILSGNKIRELDLLNNTYWYLKVLKCSEDLNGLDITNCEKLRNIVQNGTHTVVSLMGIACDSYLLGERQVVLRKGVSLRSAENTVVEINDENFPDETFRKRIANYDLTNDGELGRQEIQSITSLYVKQSTSGYISDFKGIELLPYLNEFKLSGDQCGVIPKNLNFENAPNLEKLTLEVTCEFNISQNHRLTYLALENNSDQFLKLDLTKYPKLEEISIVSYDYKIKTIDFSGLPQLKKIDVPYNYGLRELNVSQNELLESLNCNSARNLSALDLSKNLRLSNLQAQETSMAKIDLSHNTLLENVYLYGNRQLTSLDFTGCDSIQDVTCSLCEKLEKITFGEATDLVSVRCYGCPLEELNFPSVPNLSYLEIRNTRIPFLNLMNCPKLLDIVSETESEPSEGNSVQYFKNYDNALYINEDTYLIIDDKEIVGDVPLTSAFFPDKNFRNFLSQYDKDGNGKLSKKELGNIYKLNLDAKNIASLQGIRYLTFVRELSCRNNKLTELDLSNNKLKWLNCDNNQIKSLNVRTGLEYLSFANNKVSNLYLAKNNSLTTLYSDGNDLEYLDVTGLMRIKAAATRGTKDSSNTGYDSYTYSSYGLTVDKKTKLITDIIPYTTKSVPRQGWSLAIDEEFQAARDSQFAKSLADGNVSYVWYANGEIIPGETSKELMLDGDYIGKDGVTIKALILCANGAYASQEIFVSPSAKFDMTYDLRGHGSNVTERCFEGRPFTPMAPEKIAGWQFMGWYADENFSELFDFDKPRSRDCTAYALWYEEIPYARFSIDELLPGQAFNDKVKANVKKTSDCPRGFVLAGTTYWKQDPSFSSTTLSTVYEGHPYTAQFTMVAAIGYAFPELETKAEKAAFLHIFGNLTGVDVSYPLNGAMAGDAYLDWNVVPGEGKDKNRKWNVTVTYVPRYIIIERADLTFEELLVGTTYDGNNKPDAGYSLPDGAPYEIVTTPKWNMVSGTTSSDHAVNSGEVYIASFALNAKAGYKFDAFENGTDEAALFVTTHRMYGGETIASIPLLTGGIPSENCAMAFRSSDGQIVVSVIYVTEKKPLKVELQSHKDDINQTVTYVVDEEAMYQAACTPLCGETTFANAYETNRGAIKYNWYMGGKLLGTTSYGVGNGNEMAFGSADVGKTAYVVVKYGSWTLRGDTFEIEPFDNCVVRFELNEMENIGTTPETQNVKAGGKVTKPADPKTREGYEFVEWLYNDNGTEKVFIFTKPVYDNVTLYAHNVKLAAVSFNANGGTESMAKQYVYPGDDFELPECDFTAPEGMEFDSWYAFGSYWEVGESCEMNEDGTFWAIWREAPKVIDAKMELSGLVFPTPGVKAGTSLAGLTISDDSDYLLDLAGTKWINAETGKALGANDRFMFDKAYYLKVSLKQKDEDKIVIPSEESITQAVVKGSQTMLTDEVICIGQAMKTAKDMHNDSTVTLYLGLNVANGPELNDQNPMEVSTDAGKITTYGLKSLQLLVVDYDEDGVMRSNPAWINVRAGRLLLNEDEASIDGGKTWHSLSELNGRYFVGLYPNTEYTYQFRKSGETSAYHAATVKTANVPEDYLAEGKYPIPEEAFNAINYQRKLENVTITHEFLTVGDTPKLVYTATGEGLTGLKKLRMFVVLQKQSADGTKVTYDGAPATMAVDGSFVFEIAAGTDCNAAYAFLMGDEDGEYAVKPVRISKVHEALFEMPKAGPAVQLDSAAAKLDGTIGLRFYYLIPDEAFDKESYALMEINGRSVKQKFSQAAYDPTSGYGFTMPVYAKES
ncbi:MAG: hypothetical protein E7295_16555, partial [Lachnospiraceae bacterium]|nr:hypothetical protein [Lachnospiraceae bacterium]